MYLYTPWEPKEKKLSVSNECTFAVFQGYKDEWVKVALLSWSRFKKMRSLPHGKGIQGMCENNIFFYLKIQPLFWGWDIACDCNRPMCPYQVYDKGETYRIKTTIPVCDSMGCTVKMATRLSSEKSSIL